MNQLFSSNLKHCPYLLILLFTLLFTVSNKAQNSIIAPSPVDSLQVGNNYHDLTTTLDEYWSKIDSDQQGSGIKPYLRWKEMFKNSVRQNGSIPTSNDLMDSWMNVREKSKSGHSNNSNWIPLGPRQVNNILLDENSGLGRLNVIEVDPNDPNTIYAGAPGGGLWKSPDHGETWIDLSYNLPAFGISGIAVDYNNSDIIYVTSGDEDGYTNAATGVYKTIDGGLTWNAAGRITAQFLGEIYIHPNDSNMLWLVSRKGLFRTSNAGDSWTNIVSGVFKEIRLKPGDPSTIYAVADNFDDTNLYISNDSGASFTLAHTFSGIGGRAVIAVTPANPDYLYLMLSNSDNTFNSLRLSTDSGSTFEIKNQTEGLYLSYQSWFDLALAVSESDPEKLYMGCLTLHRSLDSGETISSNWSNEWELGEPYDFHVDIHDIKIFNGNLYVASDGGLYISEDEGHTFHFKSKGQNISQVYRIDVAQGLGSKVAGGLQDNGGFALSKENWYRYNNADGMDAAIDPKGEKAYGLIQFGANLGIFNFVDNTEMPANAGALGGNWVTPMEMGNGGKLYGGSDKIYYLDESQGWTAENDQSFTDIRNIRVAADNDQLILFDNGSDELYISDGMEPMVFTKLNAPSLSWNGYNGLVNFDFNRNNSQILYVLTGKGLFQSDDQGQTYKNISGSIPVDDVKVGIIHQASSDNNSLYLATTNAVYYTNDDLDDWQLFNYGLPPMQISDIEINNIENHVVLSSFGKGVWRSPVHDDALVSMSKEHFVPASSLIYPNPTNSSIAFDFELLEPTTILLYNLDGSIVDLKRVGQVRLGQEIDLSHYPSDTYILRLINENHHINIKVIKQ